MSAGQQVPAAARALGVLRVLAQAPGPLGAPAIARTLGVPRSSAYQLLAVMADEGFVVHLRDEGRYALGVAAFEVGVAYLRHSMLEHLARPALHRLVVDAGAIVPAVCHVAVLHGREVLYVVREGTGPIVSGVIEVGVRLPAALTASGRAMLARLSKEQVRALFPDEAAFVDRTGAGPTRPAALGRLLAVEARRGWAEEDGHVVEGYATVAVAVTDAQARPVASIGATFRSAQADADARAALARLVGRTAEGLSTQLAARP